MYDALGGIVTESTGRNWWRRGRMQAIPVESYATIYLDAAQGFEHDVVEVGFFDGSLTEFPWNSSRVKVSVEFFKKDAIGAANKFRNALKFDKRFFDLWSLCGLAGAINVRDISGAFMADIEPRADVEFYVLANLLEDPEKIDQIDSITVDITHVKLDNEETELSITVEDPDN
jgi:hypothetical protein